MKTSLILLGFIAILSTGFLGVHKQKPNNPPDAALAWFKRESTLFSARTLDLKAAMDHLQADNPVSLENVREIFKKCRLQYKRFAFFLEYFFPDQAFIYNGPPTPEVDLYEDEVVDPAGLQVIGSLLFNEDPYQNKKEMVKQAEMLAKSAETFPLLLNDFNTEDKDILKSIHLELIRIMTLYITGYDAPEAKTGITEAGEALSAMDTVLSSYTKNYAYKDSLEYYMRAGRTYLTAHSDFDSFNRLFFITRYALHIEKYLHQLITETGPEQNNSSALNLHAENLFSAAALNKNAFPHTENQDDPKIAGLGQQLFFETALSGNHTRSCATCHSPGNYFADGLARNRTLDGKADLPRNTPSLLYAGFQYAEFWDGRAADLETQIKTVLNNPAEMNSSADIIKKRVSKDTVYAREYKSIWPSDSIISIDRIAGALAAYVRTLAPFSSAFDHYMEGDYLALTKDQQNGFNLFMGRARCGTCHFAPLFNGLLPPEYKSTEFEILGTTSDDHFDRPKLDSDLGRYSYFPNPLNKRAFKTPSVRDAAVTLPYMHNGRFSTLKKVIDFYNRGGGTGLGLSVPEQTLSSDSLHLSEQDKADLIAFIGALTDK